MKNNSVAHKSPKLETAEGQSAVEEISRGRKYSESILWLMVKGMECERRLLVFESQLH